MTTTSVAISALFFPHIVDRILDALCDSYSLSASKLLTVSRDWHFKITTRICTHISIDHPWSARSHPITLHAAQRDPAPPLRWWFDLPDDHNDPSPIRHPLLLAAVRAARVLDIRYWKWPDYMPINDWSGCKLDMIRLHPRCINDPDLPCETLVIFTYPEIEDEIVPEEDRYCNVIENTLATKIVLHPDDVGSGGLVPVRVFLPRNVENVTVFCPFLPDEWGIGDYWTVRVADVIRHTIGGNGNSSRTFTLVSPDTSWYHRVPDPLEASWAHLRSKLQLRDDAPQLLANVEFLTTAEYRERVGEETYRLHTCMDPSWLKGRRVDRLDPEDYSSENEDGGYSGDDGESGDGTDVSGAASES